MKKKQIKAGGGVVFRLSSPDSDPEVLLIFRNGYWDLPKGKLEEDETIAMCAAREVAEEVNAELPMIIAPLSDTYHEYEENGDLVGKTTSWYWMCFPEVQQLSPQTEEGIEKIEWVPLEEAGQRVGFENLRSVLSELSLKFK